MRSLEKGVLQSLLDDPVASTQGIDIAAVGSGIIELSGSVDTMGAARHIIALVDRLPGVHAVVNRLDIEEQEDRLRHNRSQTTGGTRWYGGSVGIGKRRQGAQTDPARRDDHAALLTRSLRPNRDDTLSEVEEAEGTGTRIGLTAAGPFTTDVPPRAPNRSADRPGPPPPAET
ncbi:MAG TPA: BON domain-containing protein [Longimicrobiales bacterium]|nr:BON domain-containing protein [Longimicrobiales bacterium]